MEHIDDHAERARQDLLSQYRGKPRIEALIKALCGDSGVQELEDDLGYEQTLQDLDAALDSTNPDVQDGLSDKLEQWGKLVGTERGELTEEQFARFIKARIRANYSQVRPDELIDIFASVTDADDVRYKEHPPASYELVAFIDGGMSDALAERVDALMRDIKTSGVSYKTIDAPAPGEAFRLDTPGQGLDQGKMSTVVTESK